MLGFSTGQLLVVLGACSVMMKPSDMVKIARTAGRMTGRAVGRLIVARRQLDEILGQSAATQVHKELKDAMTQLDSIRYEVQNLSRLSPGQFMLKQHNAGMAEAGKSDSSDGPTTNIIDLSVDHVVVANSYMMLELFISMLALHLKHWFLLLVNFWFTSLSRDILNRAFMAMQQEEFRQEIRSIIRDEFEKYCRTQPIQNSVSTTEHRKLHVADEPTALKSKDMKMANSGLTNLHNQAMTYARLSEAPGLKMDSSLSGNYKDQSKEMDGLLTVLPISAESAGLLPSRPDKPTGSDLVLEAVLEAEVAENAKLFVSQPHDQLPKE
ncbi:hypothetical protein ZEAMMB73_Zm00001d053104 [Zea mays]|uniref:Uncharacterized protein n=2 Tax=Zea mays TaxID=4577 RepID=A0A1D6QM66_MAIZE|nr:hypothetical protein ZEAMMB73_Zm00001d053104 [Zea mays]